MRLLILILLSGCAHDPTFTDKTVCVRTVITNEDLQLNGKNVYGLTWPLLNPCLIKVERKHYTNEIMGHEFIHCLDGYWHK